MQAAGNLGRRGPVPHVQRDRQHPRAQFGGQVLEPVRAPGGGDHPGTRGREPVRDRGPEAAARTGDEDGARLRTSHADAPPASRHERVYMPLIMARAHGFILIAGTQPARDC
jgi:hypothetical protein